MKISLIKPSRIFELNLPTKVKGQYWIKDIDNLGCSRELISIEAIAGEWVIKSNKTITVLDEEKKPINSVILQESGFYELKSAEASDRIILYAESEELGRKELNRYLVKGAHTFLIGRSVDADICYQNRLVSKRHANLIFDGSRWSIKDLDSTNGTYVNQVRIDSIELHPGDSIYIMGLTIIIGNNYIATNNPDNLLQINKKDLLEFSAQQFEPKEEEELKSKDFFFRSPRFHREIEHATITIDSPPRPEKLDTVPTALMLGPALTMGMTSVSTAIFSVSNILANGGKIAQAMPSIVMAVGMLAGTVMWPILTKKYEKKKKIESENLRQKKYFAYLNEKKNEIAEIGKTQCEILRENCISPEECANRIDNRNKKLWERAIGQSDFLRLRLGIGDLPVDIEINYSQKQFSMENDNLIDAMLAVATEPYELKAVPISVSLIENKTIGVYGNYAARNSLVKSMILQMVELHSYDELKIILLVDEANKAEWNFVRFLPHFWTDDKEMRLLAINAGDVKDLASYLDKNVLSRTGERDRVYSPHYVIISTSKVLAKKCDSIQQIMQRKEKCGCSILVVDNELSDLPKETNLVVEVEENNAKIYEKDDTSGKSTSFVPDMIENVSSKDWSTNLANIELDISTQNYILPSMLSFLEMFHVSKIEYLNSLTRWKENNPTKTIQTPIGVDTYGETFYLDLHEKFHGPHGLVAGMTGSGKSEFIITYILSLAVNYHPDEVAFILIDYKGGGLTGAFEDADRGIKLPHLAGTITNLDGSAIKRSLVSIQSELRRRQAIFNEARKISNAGTMDIYKYQQLYRDKVVNEPVPHLFIISDEFAELKAQQPEFMEQLISTARIGRSLGVHLILATQKPNGVVDDQIWSNSKFRVCLKVQDKADSQDMIKCPDAAELSQTGRFYLQVGFNELFALGQSAWCGAEYVPSDVIEKSVDESIQVIDNIGRVTMSVKPEAKRENTKSEGKQIVAIVKYLSDLAEEENISVRSLWLPPIPAYIYVDDLEKKYQIEEKGTFLDPVVGEYDDPYNQSQNVLTVPLSSEGNCLVYGSTGNGKTTFLTTLAYSLIKNHTAEEMNLYIMDFSSETLRVFANAPQVGGFVTAADDEKIVNLLKMIMETMDERKVLFSEFGGDYESYCKNSGKIVPNIVVLINNFAVFGEQFEDLVDMFNIVTRDGTKYGIYFVITAGAISAVRYKTQQNFKTMFTMQLNDESDYSIVVGKTDGLVPTRCKGRGLVNLGGVYEFQTAYCIQAEDSQAAIRQYCKQLAENATCYARAIPVLPDIVNYQSVRTVVDNLMNVPIGIGKKNLHVITVNLENKVVYPVIAQELYEASRFAEELSAILAHIGKTSVFDAEKILIPDKMNGARLVVDQFESEIVALFSEMVTRNNAYKDAKLDMAVLEKYEEHVYVIVGIQRLFDLLSEDGKEKLMLLIEKAEAFYKLHFVIIENATLLNGHSYEAWYKRHISGKEGLWIGDGVADQYMLKINKITSDLYAEVGNEYGYIVSKNRPMLIKLLSSEEKEA